MNTVETNVDVLIAGAGPTGLVLAIDLARRGVRYRLVERAERGFPGSRGMGIQPRTQEVFDDLGVIGAIAAAGGPCPPVQVWEGRERVRTWDLVERADTSPAIPYPEILMVPQWRTVEELCARLEELGGTVDFGTELTEFAQDADGVTAVLRGADGATETVRAAYLVGTDGGRSTVRSMLGTAFNGNRIDETATVVADLELEGELDRDHWHMWPKAEGGFLALRGLEGTEAFQTIVRFTDPAFEPDLERDATPQALTRTIARRTGLADLRVTQVHWSSVYRPRAAMAERFRTGHVFLAGDAAHIHSPAGGQGLNTSVQDAYNLGWKLAAVLRGGAPDALLDTYDDERGRVAADVLGLSTRQHIKDRSSGSNGLSRRGPETHQLHLNYRESGLTREHRDAVPEDALHAGDRAPDAPCRDASGEVFRLFDAFRGPHFTLLDLTGAGGTEVTEVTGARTYRIGGPSPDLLDPEGHAKAAYGSGLFLVRPDGYVAVATDELGDVTGYLAQVAG
ncbi:FAD-dependent monooxygenase [Streptomyces sp. NPDC001404]|uniref:FAD-dependent monooxygenase n=1 Tax=Streptomyces sp. NPDC001404 TaxID=3364571 RepID=UPI0036C22152